MRGIEHVKRYTAFGHLFAGYQGKTYRIDRHPVMSRHPVTPMDEADLALHLARKPGGRGGNGQALPRRRSVFPAAVSVRPRRHVDKKSRRPGPTAGPGRS